MCRSGSTPKCHGSPTLVGTMEKLGNTCLAKSSLRTVVCYGYQLNRRGLFVGSRGCCNPFSSPSPTFFLVNTDPEPSILLNPDPDQAVAESGCNPDPDKFFLMTKNIFVDQKIIIKAFFNTCKGQRAFRLQEKPPAKHRTLQT